MNVRSHRHARLAVLLLLLLPAVPATARITKSRSSASASAPPTIAEGALWQPLYSTIIGAGLEFTREDGVSEWGIPILVEYSATENLVFTVEPKYIFLSSDSPDESSVSGWSDLETSVIYEFLRERRYRPALSFEGTVRWPVAAHEDLGEPGHDYTIGLIASKDLVYVEVDLNALYTFSGDSDHPDEFEVSVAASWHLNPWVDFIAEASFVSQNGGRADEVALNRTETEVTLGLAWLVSKHFILEQGIILKEHGEWEAILAWEWSFGGDD
jgi:hypothetical protein